MDHELRGQKGNIFIFLFLIMLPYYYRDGGNLSITKSKLYFKQKFESHNLYKTFEIVDIHNFKAWYSTAYISNTRRDMGH